MRYFEQLPKDFYTLIDNGKLDVVTNITSKVTLDEDVKKNSSAFYTYIVPDGETPEHVADKVYGNSNRHWIILHMNDIVDPQAEWALSENNLNKVIEKKYEEMANGAPVLNWTKTNIRNYFKIEQRNNIDTRTNNVDVLNVDANTYSNIVPSQTSVVTKDGNNIRIIVDKRTLTYYEFEHELNNRKREIKILKPEFVEVVERQLEDYYL